MIDDPEEANRNPAHNPDPAEYSNTSKDPADWVTGDEPMTGAQASYLQTLCEEMGVEFDPSLNKAAASELIDSLKARNPADRPDEYERSVLEAWAAQWEEGLLPEESAEATQVDGRAVLRYMRPITIMAPCLTCHGDPATMMPELRAVLDERYPGDEAVGYAEGDLRGAYTVTVEME